MQRVLITGAAGLLGSRLADWIISNRPDCKVLGIDNLSGGYREHVNSKVDFVQIDCQSEQISNVFERFKPDVVYHFAAYAAEGLSPFIRKFNYDNNLLATANIINECIKHSVDRLVFTSSMAVYGIGNPPFDEQDQPSPIDPYGVAKYACEMDIQIAGEQHGLDWCIIRPHNVYGEKQNIWDTYRNVLGIWMYQNLMGAELTIFGDGSQKRAFSYIGDMLEPLWKAGIDDRASKQIVNLGSGKEYSINEACDTLCRIMGGGKKVYKEQRHEVKNAHPTWEKSVSILDYEDKTSLEEGLGQMWEWAKVQPSRPRFMWENYEIDKGIYDFWKQPSVTEVK